MGTNIHSEGDVKLKIIIPYLEELGFIKEELDFETNFQIKYGKSILPVGATKPIEISNARLDILVKYQGNNDFVKLEEIDPRHYESSYYLVPGTGAQKAYALLLQSMAEANVVGVAKFVLRSKEYLAAIRPTESALTLSTMLFADEIVKTSELETYLPNDIKLTDKELNMARQLINSLITKFEPTQYENEYYKSVVSLIDSKSDNAVGSKVSGAPGKVIDIMAALEASIKAMNTDKPKKSHKVKHAG